MAAHTHWRLRCPIRPTNSYSEISEMALLDGSSVDLTVGGTASASSQLSVAYVPANAFDKSNAASWSNSGTGDADCWLQYQTPAPVDPVYVQLRTSVNPPGAMWLEGSDTGSPPWERRNLLGAALVTNTTMLYVLTTAPYSGSGIAFATPQVWTPDAPSSTVVVENLAARMRVHNRDWVHGGPGRIYGNVFKKGTPADFPAVARVRLHREVDSLAIRETWSNSAGAYEFTDLSLDYKYSATARDHNHDYRGVVADNLTPEVAP